MYTCGVVVEVCTHSGAWVHDRWLESHNPIANYLIGFLLVVLMGKVSIVYWYLSLFHQEV